jgi:hypothetical protein
MRTAISATVLSVPFNTGYGLDDLGIRRGRAHQTCLGFEKLLLLDPRR